VHTLQDDLWCFIMYMQMKVNIKALLEIDNAKKKEEGKAKPEENNT